MHILRRLSLVFILVILVGFGGGIIALRVSGLRALSVQTGSMDPTIRVHDLVLVAPRTPTQVTSGAVVAFRSQTQPGLVIMHRLIAVDRTANTLVTKGDANDRYDVPVPTQALDGEVVYVIPYIGGLVDAACTPYGLVLLVYLPALLIIYAEIRRAYRGVSTQRHYIFRTQ